MAVLRHGQLDRPCWGRGDMLLGFCQEEHHIRRVLQIAAFFERIERGARVVKKSKRLVLPKVKNSP
jgi:hypothetical protein